MAQNAYTPMIEEASSKGNLERFGDLIFPEPVCLASGGLKRTTALYNYCKVKVRNLSLEALGFFISGLVGEELLFILDCSNPGTAAPYDSNGDHCYGANESTC